MSLGSLRDKFVLEIGAGAGEFLSAVRLAGARVIANEISPEASDFLEGALQIPVVRGDLTCGAWQHGSPDVIVMSDLIEHPSDPAALLAFAVGLLKPGGRLLIWTPNGGGAGMDLASALKWVGFRVDLEHLQYFSSKTLQVLANRWGLHIEHLETTGYAGLDEIELPPEAKVPRLKGRIVAQAKTLIKRVIPGSPRLIDAVRAYRSPRTLGSYHLFAILEKS